MNEFEKRSAFWDDHHPCKSKTDSKNRPFLVVPDWAEYFKENKILEIGAGAGRQLNQYSDLAADVHVYDISKKVLDRYKDRFTTQQIKNYKKSPKYSIGYFDTITFWYVVHHIRKNELSDFVNYVAQLLKPGGRLMFNVPDVNADRQYGHFANVETNIGDDGIKTTGYTIDEILRIFGDKFTLTVWNTSYDNTVCTAKLD